MKASDVIGKYLIAEQDVPVTNMPNGQQIGVVPKGNSIGPVYSYVQRGNDIFWMFDYTIPGQSPGAYWALHKPSYWKLSTVSGEPITITTGIFAKQTMPLYYALIGLAGLYLLTQK
jgi:hypothetical protein